MLLTLVGAVSAFSQGTVAFQNNNAGTVPAINAPIWYAQQAGTPWDIGTSLATGAPGDVTMPTATSGGQIGRVDSRAGLLVRTANGFDYSGQFARAGLYGGPAGTASDTWTLLVPAVGFVTGVRGYVNVGTSSSRTMQGVPAGGSATVQIRAWDAGVAGIDSFESARALVSADHGVYLGQSTPMTINLGGTGVPPGPATDLVGLQQFAMVYSVVPEPSIIGLGILGAVAGLMVFRRRS